MLWRLKVSHAMTVFLLAEFQVDTMHHHMGKDKKHMCVSSSLSFSVTPPIL